MTLEVPGADGEGLVVLPGPVAGTLAIEAKVPRREPSRRALRLERRVRSDEGRYKRVLPVAWDADVASATPTLENGVLRIVVPKVVPKKSAERDKKAG